MTTTSAEELQLEDVLRRNDAAHKMVSDLCHGRRDWVMSIPAREDYDPDLVIGASLRDIPEVLSEPLEALDALGKYSAEQRTESEMELAL
ncbi:MAG TPA: hypothetical protein VN519_06620 [Bryobacteraceae bacterium]|nr:hypothetical protein [Bryobacteraceae bacterium]